MNQTLLIILVIAILSFIGMGQMTENFYEAFMPIDPNFYIDSCRNLSKEKLKVDLLANNYCSNSSQMPLLPNRDNINTNETCYDQTGRKIILENEKNNWCSRLSLDQQRMIEKELNQQMPPSVLAGSPTSILFPAAPVISDYEGSDYINKQLYQQTNVSPNGIDHLDDRYASF